MESFDTSAQSVLFFLFLAISMLKPIHFENEELLIHPFRAEDLERFEELAQDLFSILSNDHTLKFIPAKRLKSLEEARVLLQNIVLNFHSGRSYVHFITHKMTNKVIGIIDLISPQVAREHYKMDYYPFFIEFYLGAFASGCYIMTEILPPVIDNILSQGVKRIGAVINRKNIAARKVLENASFSYKATFDMTQDLYEVV